MKQLSMWTVVCGLFLSPMAFGQEQPNQPLTGKEFVAQAFEANQAEIATSELAKDRATNPKVKEYAAKMVQDHTNNREKLLDRAKDLKVGVAAGVNNVQKKLLDQLQKNEGKEFDQAYMKAQVEAHKKTIGLYESAAKNLDNPELKQFAQESLKSLREHLEHAQEVSKSLQNE